MFRRHLPEGSCGEPARLYAARRGAASAGTPARGVRLRWYNGDVRGNGEKQPRAIDIWRIQLDAPAAREVIERLLSPDEHERMKQFVFDRHRRAFALTRAALRLVLAERLGISAADICFEYGEFGKPRVAGSAGPHFSVSHSGELALIAVCEGSPIGVDIERLRPIPEALEIAERFFAPPEWRQLRDASDAERSRAFLTLWTRKEAALKALGWGLSIEGVRIDASVPDRVEVSRDSQASLTLATRPADAPPEYVAAVAMPDLIEIDNRCVAIREFSVRAEDRPCPRSGAI